MWERYCRGVSAILFVVDSAVPLPQSQEESNNAWNIAADELHALIEKPNLAGVPLLVLATKNDIKGAAGVDQVIKVM